jgi:hypothetical protein
MAVAAIFLAPTAGLTVAAKKRAENRRRQAAANDFSKKYPLSDDAATMQSYIAQATTEVKNLNAQPATTAGAKRVKKRNVEMLNKWILVMKDHSKDLKAGISVATTQVAPVPPVSDLATQTPASAVMPDVLPPAPAAEGEPAVEGAAPKKGTNWLLIGGAVVGVILLVNLLKKR